MICLQLGNSPTLDTLTIAENIYLLMSMFEICSIDFEHRKYNLTYFRLANFALETSVSQSRCNIFHA